MWSTILDIIILLQHVGVYANRINMWQTCHPTMLAQLLARFESAFIDFIHSNFEVSQREVLIVLLSVNLFFVFVV